MSVIVFAPISRTIGTPKPGPRANRNAAIQKGTWLSRTLSLALPPNVVGVTSFDAREACSEVVSTDNGSGLGVPLSLLLHHGTSRLPVPPSEMNVLVRAP